MNRTRKAPSGRTAAQNQRRKELTALTDRLDAPLDLESHLPYRVAVLSNLLLVDRDPLVRSITDLGLRELRVLLNVGSYMPVRATDIAYQTRMGSFTVSRAINTLLSEGWIRNEPNPLDARAVMLELTPKGKKLYAQITKLLDRRERLVCSVLSAQEQTLLLDLLGRLEDSAEKVLAEEALSRSNRGDPLTMEQKELLRWFKRGVQKKTT
jgi:DNA-binding MarR family transcriptional regulator